LMSPFLPSLGRQSSHWRSLFPRVAEFLELLAQCLIARSCCRFSA
jgi:hypothetical protein